MMPPRLYTEADIKQQAAELMDMDDNAATILFKRMIRKAPHVKDQPRMAEESVDEMLDRVAMHVGQLEPMQMRLRFRNLLERKDFFPNSPTFTGAGTPLNQLAACFVLPLSDDLGREPDGILSTLRVAGLIQQTGGGNGFSFGRLREKGAPVGRSNGVSTGPVGFLSMSDKCFETISQGGSRRGANMGIMPVDHPDIEEFVDCKKGSEAKVCNFNISVAISDDFMEAVRDGAPWPLISRAPPGGAVVRTVDARALFYKIATNACANGEPGIVLIDEANRWNPVPEIYTLEATNPCGEQWLGPYENCCLGSIKMSHFVTTDCKIDAGRLAETVHASTRFLDCVVEVNGYLPCVPEIRAAAMLCRRIGLGLMGLADLLILLGARYGSPEAQWVSHLVVRFMRYHALLESCRLAEEKGAALGIDRSIYKRDQCADTIARTFQWRPEYVGRDYGPLTVTGAMLSELVERIKAHGIRNLAQLTIAPTGSIANVTGCEAGGCEPIFMLAYQRNVTNGDGEAKTVLPYQSELLRSHLLAHGMDEAAVNAVFEEVIANGGSCAGLESVPEEVRRIFVTSQDIPWREHIEMQAALQRSGIDNSISKTINMPPGSTPEDVGEAYKLAHSLGCKGLTVYVTGSRKTVVLEAAAMVKKSPSNLVEISEGHCIHLRSPLGNLYTHVVNDAGGDPSSVFFNIGKAGSDANALAEGFGRLISLAIDPSLGDMSPMERMAAIAAQLRGIGGSSSVGLGPLQVRSLPDTMGLALSTFCENQDAPVQKSPSYDLCPDCSVRLVYEEGCVKCPGCGWSRC